MGPHEPPPLFGFPRISENQYTLPPPTSHLVSPSFNHDRRLCSWPSWTMINNIRPVSFRQKSWWTEIHHPNGRIITRWNHIFLTASFIALFLDPLYFYLPLSAGEEACMMIDLGLGIFVTFFRTVTDLFYLVHVFLKFRTAYVAPSSRVFGRGELVTDPWLIALRYMKSDFIVDFSATLPLPQVIIKGYFLWFPFSVLFWENWNQIRLGLYLVLYDYM